MTLLPRRRQDLRAASRRARQEEDLCRRAAQEREAAQAACAEYGARERDEERTAREKVRARHLDTPSRAVHVVSRVRVF